MNREYKEPEFRAIRINNLDIITSSQDIIPGSSGWETGGEGGDVPFVPVNG